MTNALWSDRHLEVLVGDAGDVLASLPSESVHCMVTSPPYWGLRDYGIAEWVGGTPGHAHRGTFARTAPPGTAKQASNAGANDVRSGDCECGATREPWEGGDPECDHELDQTGRDRTSTLEGGKATQRSARFYGRVCGRCGAQRRTVQLGLEDEPDDFVESLVAIFREAKRVLRKDGSLWMNLGDTYGGSSGSSSHNGLSASADLHDPRPGAREPNRAERGETPYAARIRRGVRDKDLVGIPWRVALALQADGWYLRADIIWSKPNPMPSSTTDRPTVSHEYMFLLTKSPRYYYDADAVREVTGREATWDEWRDADGHHQPYDRALDLLEGVSAGWGRKRDTLTHPLGRNLRSVWTIATQPYRGAHFATFPEALVEPCVLAGTSAYGVCQTCGAPWRRVVEVDYKPVRATGGMSKRYWGPDAVGKDGVGYPNRSPSEKTLTEEATEAGQAPGPQGMTYGRAEKLVETVGWKPGCEHGGMVIPATVLDPFAGSGTTGAVAQRLGRRAILIDAKGDYLLGQAMKRNEQMPLGLLGSSSTPLTIGLEDA